MSLWTPDGERPISRNPTPSDESPGPPTAAESDRPLSAEEQEQAREIIANHAMGLYELAAIHLTADEPKLPQARLAIDALGALVEGLAGRLGAENEEVLSEALAQARMAFVQRSSSTTAVEDDHQDGDS
jgi:hypothetical protein